jgi:hypothetical protein
MAKRQKDMPAAKVKNMKGRRAEREAAMANSQQHKNMAKKVAMIDLSNMAKGRRVATANREEEEEAKMAITNSSNNMGDNERLLANMQKANNNNATEKTKDMAKSKKEAVPDMANNRRSQNMDHQKWRNMEAMKCNRRSTRALSMTMPHPSQKPTATTKGLFEGMGIGIILIISPIKF